MEYQQGLKRAVAYIIDQLITSPIYFLLSNGSGVNSREESLAMIVYVIVFLAYMSIMEGNYSTTIGKRLMGIRVLMENGEKPTIKTAVIRNILRLVDALPTLYIVGIIVITVTKKKQRVGDLAANTVVVANE